MSVGTPDGKAAGAVVSVGLIDGNEEGAVDSVGLSDGTAEGDVMSVLGLCENMEHMCLFGCVMA